MEIQNRKKVVHKYLENPALSYSAIAQATGISKSTVGDVIRRYKATLSVDRAKGSGAKAGPRDPNLHKKILRSISANPGTSDRKRAHRIGTSRSMVIRTRNRACLKSFRAIKVPNRNDRQNIFARKRARKLYEGILTKFRGCLVLDDETYVKVDQKQIPGQKFYIADKRLNVPSKYKFIKVYKFGKKLLIWQAI